MRSRTFRGPVSATAALVGVLVLPAYAIDRSPPQVYIETTLVEVNRTDLVRFGLGTLKPRQRPSQGDVDFLVPELEAARDGLLQISQDIGLDPDLSGTSMGLGAQRWFGQSTLNLDLAIQALENRSRARIISRPLVTAFSSQMAAITAFQGRPVRFSEKDKKRNREVVKYVDLLWEWWQENLQVVTFSTLGDFFEPFDKVKKRAFESSTGLALDGNVKFRLRRRRGNTVMEIRGASDTPAGAEVGIPFEVGNDFSAMADLGVLLKVTPQILSDRDGVVVFLEVAQPVESAWQCAGFEFGTDGITGAFVQDQGGLRSTTPIDTIPNIDRSSVTAFVDVRNGTVVLGGLFTRTDASNQKVPVLLDEIPVIGSLFRVTAGADNVTKKGRAEADNLLIFLTPRIITD